MIQREIKFRAKRTDGVGWAYGYFVKTPITAEFNAVSGQFFDSSSADNIEWGGRYCIVQSTVAHEIDINTLGQFTGLRDKNEKEIYEGDIVRQTTASGTDPHSRPVVFITGTFGAGRSFDFHNMITGIVEVIGNIFENSELLSQEKVEIKP